jgi:putative nucleotidyltransferase with HDIG domain
MRDLLIHSSSPPGDDGLLSISPKQGIEQGAASSGASLGSKAPLAAFIALLAACALALAAWLVVEGYAVESPWLLVALALLGIAAERGSIRLNSNLEVTVSSLPTLFAAVVGGPLTAMIVAAASVLGVFGAPYTRWAVYTFGRATVGALTGLAASTVDGLTSSQLGRIAISTAVAAIVYEVLDAGLACLTLWVRRTGSVREVLEAGLPVMPTAVVLYVAVIAPLGIAYEELSPWAVVLFLFPAVAAQRLYAMYQEQRRLAQDLSVANQSLERANLSFASALVTTLDARDRYTAGHSAAVAVYARDIAQEMELSTETQQLAHLSGLLHDIGKIGVPPGVLEKNGPLTLDERRKMEEHSAIGERILANVEAYAEIARIVRHHHERIDGQGYPDGFLHEEIPVISRIICVADAYNAMTSARPYRDAMPVELARSRLRQAAGTQFDPVVVAAFDAILETASETYSSGARADFALEAQAHPELRPVLEVSAA